MLETVLSGPERVFLIIIKLLNPAQSFPKKMKNTDALLANITIFCLVNSMYFVFNYYYFSAKNGLPEDCQVGAPEVM